jgi:hypothetical protein
MQSKAYKPAPVGQVYRTQGFLWDLFGMRRRDVDRSSTSVPVEPDGPSSRLEATPQRWGTYRTVCVRLCDGFYWPISHATTRDRFSRDAKQCERGCPNRSRLFYHPSGSDADALVDLNGGSYANLKNAFRYRTEYISDCTCKANPWEEEALARHRAYAEAAKASKEKPDTKTTVRASKAEPRSRWARTHERGD